MKMSRLLLVKENFLNCSGIFQGSNKKLDKQDIERIFNSYDRVSTFQCLRLGLEREMGEKRERRRLSLDNIV